MKIVFITSLFILLLASILFGVVFHYCYALKYIDQSPLKETLSLTFSFIGSVGTVASIASAFLFYLKQIEKDKDEAEALILRNKPKLFIKISDIYASTDRNKQPSLTMDLNIEIYNNNASSLSLSYEYIPNTSHDILVEFDYPPNYKSALNSGDNLNVSAAFTYVNNIDKCPNLGDIHLYIKAVYLDKLNNTIEEYYLLKSVKRKSQPIGKLVKTNILTATGQFIEIK